MSDVARHLPLSQRPPSDESTVSNDWRPLIGQSLMLVTDLLAGLTPEQWTQHSSRPGRSVRDVVGQLAWRLGASGSERAKSRLSAAVAPRRSENESAFRVAGTSPSELIATLRKIADARLAARGRRGVGQLTDVIVAGYDIAYPLGLRLTFAPVATGAVAVARSVTGPIAIKAVLRDRTLTASDAGWSVGRGTELPASAESIIRFLFARSTRL